MKFNFTKTIFIISILVSINCFGCSTSNNVSSKNSNLNYDEEMKNYTIGEYNYLYNYAIKYDIKLNEFSDRDKVLNSIKNLNSEENMMYLTTESNWFSEPNYKITNEKTNIIYCGEIKDNKPNGIGAIYQVNEGINFVKYLGYFTKGLFNGYGMLFNIPTDNDFYYATIIYDNNKEKATKRANYLLFDGIFEDGEANGKGNYYEYCDLQIEMYMVQDGKNKSKDIDIYVGDFIINENKIKGKGKEYKEGFLYYDGEYENSTFDGDGILYFSKSKQKEYEGSFKNGKYNGKGILYDKDGNKIYSGKWSMGDYK